MLTVTYYIMSQVMRRKSVNMISPEREERVTSAVCLCPVQLMNVNETVEENVSVGPLGLCMYCNINQHSLPASRVSRALV